MEAITSADEVAELRGIFDGLFASRAGWEQGRAFDLAGADEAGKEPVLPQIINPVEFAPALASTRFRVNALAIARQLIGPGAEPWFEHAINKPARIGAATPWHQDEAHRYDPGVDYEQISIWMPLQPATLENGCMQYIPGSHRGPVLEHHSLNDDPRISALECCATFDATKAVACPLPAGGAAIHHCRTLHCASANVTGQPRRAYILAFRGAPVPAPAREMFPWLRGKQTPAAQRAASWENRGGAVGRAGRAAAGVARRAARKISRMFRK